MAPSLTVTELKSSIVTPLTFERLIDEPTPETSQIELETSNKDIISVKVERKRKANITTLLRAIGWDTDQKIL